MNSLPAVANASPHLTSLLFLLLAPAVMPLPAATVRTWSGASATSGNWTTAANWDNGAPVAGDILNFTSTGARKASNTNNYPAGTTFSTLNLFGTGYRLRGNSVTISNYVGQGSPTGTNTIDLDLAAAGPGVGITLRSTASADRLTLNGDISLNARTLFTEGPGDYIIGGVISGSAGIYKGNTGDLSLSGAGANTFTGTTIVNAGILRLNRYFLLGGFGGTDGIVLPGTVAIPGDLVIGTGTGGLTADIVVLDRDNQIANTSDVTVNGSGSLELSDENDTIGSLTLTAGFITTGTGTLTLGGPVTVNAGTEDAVISGKVNLGAGTDRLFNVLQGAELTVSAVISGSAGISLVKSNRGDLVLTASNIFDGPVEIAGGSLVITHGSALGTTNGPTRPTLGRLAISGSIGIGEPLESPGPSGMIEVLSGNPSWIGSVRLDDDLNIYVPTNSTFTINGLISGPAGWFKFGVGTLQFKTTYTNTYAGTGTLREGDIILDGVFHQPVISGPLIIGYTNNTPGSERVSYIKQHQIADHVPITINKSGLLALSFADDTVGAITFNGGAIDTGSGTLTLNGDILANATNQTASVSGNLALGGANRTIYTLGAASSPDLRITAAISDGTNTGGITKVGEGTLLLTASNSYTGLTVASDGELILANSFALGGTNGGTMVSSDALLTLRSNIHIPREALTLDSVGIVNLGVFLSQFGTNSWAGDIVILSNANVNVPDVTDRLTLSGAISSPNASSLTKIGDGTLVFSGSTGNSYGDTFVNSGTLELAQSPPTDRAVPGNLFIGDGIGGFFADRVRVRFGDQIPNTSAVTISAFGLLEIDNTLDLIGSLAGTGQVRLPTASSGLVVGRNDLSTVYSGVISGLGGFHKVGAGTLTLTGTNTFTGQSAVSEGSLIVNGSLASSSLLSLNQPISPANNYPAILGGSGTVPRIFPYAGGIVAPGSSPGRLTVQGELALTNDIVRIELNGTAPGTGYDQIRVNGLVKLGNSRLELALGFTPVIDDTFMLIQNDGVDPVQGTFLGLPQASYFSAGGLVFYIEYDAGDDDNEVVITRVPTPTNEISSILPITAERMQILGQGVPGLAYVLEAAPHLNAPIPWTSIATNTANALGIYEFIDAYTDQGMNLYPMRFYRVRWP